ncbi:MAG: radical SAM protein [Bacteroidales bacterium]
MKTILEPIKPFGKLLGKQRRKSDATYRLMNFVVQTPVDEGLLLLHTMTKEMLLLSPEEQQVFEKNPVDLPELIDKWYLVPTEHDDRKLSRQLRKVAKIMSKPQKGITGFTIMTTSDCNAHCFYCYELGQSRLPMSEETARQTAQFIINHCEKKAVNIEWFGGEPLFNKPVITLICNLLKEAGVKYTSSMISNGYLFDADTVKEAKELWNLKRVQITIDGTEQIYNRVKAYIYKGVNAYQRVMDNIEGLLKAKIAVAIRMNIDMHNAEDLENVVDYLHERFGKSKLLSPYVHTLFEDEKIKVAVLQDDKRKKVLAQRRHIHDKLHAWGMYNPGVFEPYIKTNNCMSDSTNHVVVQPSGHLTKCEHYTDSHHVGHVAQEGFDEQMLAYFRAEGEEPQEACATCAHYPMCYFLNACPNLKECYPEMPADYVHEMQDQMRTVYASFLKPKKNAKKAQKKKESQPKKFGVMNSKIEVVPLASHYVVAFKNPTTLHMNKVMKLNALGVDILVGYVEERPAQELALELAKRYEANAENMLHEVTSFYADLEKY